MTNEEQETEDESSGARRLVWALPLAFVLSLPVIWIAVFVHCGIGSCSGTFAVDTSRRAEEWRYHATVGAIFAVVLTLVPWTQPLGRRFVFSLAMGVGAGLILAAYLAGLS